MAPPGAASFHRNNLSYFAFLTELLRSPALDNTVRLKITMERDRVENWLLNIAYDTSRGRMRRGFNPQGTDPVQALDTTTWLLLGHRSSAPGSTWDRSERLMLRAEATFEVTVGDRKGVDPTDQNEADYTYAELQNHLEEINRPTRIAIV